MVIGVSIVFVEGRCLRRFVAADLHMSFIFDIAYIVEPQYEI